MSQPKTPKDIGCQNEKEAVIVREIDKFLSIVVHKGWVDKERLLEILLSYVEGMIDEYEKHSDEEQDEEAESVNIPIEEADNNVSL